MCQVIFGEDLCMVWGKGYNLTISTVYVLVSSQLPLFAGRDTHQSHLTKKFNKRESFKTSISCSQG